MVEKVDTTDLKSVAVRRAGSIPAARTILRDKPYVAYEVYAHGSRFIVREVVAYYTKPSNKFIKIDDETLINGHVTFVYCYRQWRVTYDNQYIFSFRNKFDAFRYCDRLGLRFLKQGGLMNDRLVTN